MVELRVFAALFHHFAHRVQHRRVVASAKQLADFGQTLLGQLFSQIHRNLAQEVTMKSLPEIGEKLGGRDHTTVLHAVRKMMEKRGKDAQLNHELHVLEQTLKG